LDTICCVYKKQKGFCDKELGVFVFLENQYLVLFIFHITTLDDGFLRGYFLKIDFTLLFLDPTTIKRK
jgi:hypothetical protein